MNEEIRSGEVSMILAEKESEDNTPTVESILSLFQENLSALTEIKIMLVGYFDRIKNNQHSKELMTGLQVQQCLRISKSTLKRYRKSGVLRVLNINNSYRYFSEEVREFMKITK